MRVVDEIDPAQITALLVGVEGVIRFGTFLADQLHETVVVFLVARYKYRVCIGIEPSRMDGGHDAVFADDVVGYGKVHRMQRVLLVFRTVAALGAIVGGAHVQSQILIEPVHLTGKRIAHGEFRAVAFGIARVCIGLRDGIFRHGSFIRQLYAADLIHASVVVHGVQNIQPLGIRKAYFELIEPALIACFIGVVEKYLVCNP